MAGHGEPRLDDLEIRMRQVSGMANSVDLTVLAGSSQRFAPDELSACDKEAIHIPGAIQPYGLLLVADPTTLLITAGAGDIENLLATEWLGRSVADLLGQDITNDTAALVSGTLDMAVIDQVKGYHALFDGILRYSNDNLLIELEPAGVFTRSEGRMLSTVDAIGCGFDRAMDFQSLCDAAAVGFRKLTGFDRVMIYRFLDDGAGTVVADDKVAEIGSFLNHHFPAADIPKQARALYVRNRIRVIPDVHYKPAPVRPVAGDVPLDMSDIALRSVSPIHIQYLKNMGVAASASVSIVMDGVLWGLVACHHRQPRQLPYEIRSACSALAGMLARQIKGKADDESYRQRIRLRSQEDAVVAHLGSALSLQGFLADTGNDLAKMLAANGFAAMQRNDLYVAGECPDDAGIRKIAAWVEKRAVAQPYSTDCLGTDLPDVADAHSLASGLLAVTMSTEEPIILMWFRAEQVQIVDWAGNPHKTQANGAATDIADILTPRASFAAWSETVRGLSSPWTLAEIECANRLRRTMFDIRQSNRLRTLNQDLASTVADNESLLVQKDFLIKEVNHRIQNSLTLVSSFLRLQAKGLNDQSLTAHLDEAQRRISAVALVHRRLYSGDQVQTVDLARYLDDLCTEMTSSMGAEWGKQITVDLAPILMEIDRAINVGLILTELLINANKYAYDGAPGPIAVSLSQHRNSFRLVVADRGKGKFVKSEGFGTKMLNAMVRSLSGSLGNDNSAAGLQVILEAPVQG